LEAFRVLAARAVEREEQIRRRRLEACNDSEFFNDYRDRIPARALLLTRAASAAAAVAPLLSRRAVFRPGQVWAAVKEISVSK